MTEQSAENDTVAKGWDAEKVQAHLADLRERKAQAEAIYEAFVQAAKQHDREAHRLEQQIAHCRDLFRKPRVIPPGEAGGADA
jgi:uncharacterized protein YciW